MTYTSGGDAEDFWDPDFQMTELEKRRMWPGDYDDDDERPEGDGSAYSEVLRKHNAEYRERQLKSKSSLEVEWDYLKALTGELSKDLESVRKEADSRGVGMETYARLRKSLDTAAELLNARLAERLADVITREIGYVRQGLDSYREWMGRELDRRSQRQERDERERARDAQTRTYRNAVTNRSDKSRISRTVQQLEEDLRRVRHPNYRVPRTGD